MTAERVERVRSALGDLDALLVLAPANVRWLTGLVASRAALLVGRTADVLAVDGRYAEQARALPGTVEVVETRGDGWLAERVTAGARLGFEDDHVPWGRVEALRTALEGVELVPAAGRVEAERVVKDAAELALLGRACAITAAALSATFTELRPGLSEREVARLVEDALRARGAEDRAFETIVASGPNGARPHHRAGDRRLAAGDLVTIDTGALVGGYHADMTRTVALGRPEARLVEAYEAVQAAQAAGVAALQPGVAAEEVDAAARRVLVDAGLEDALRHATGHGVGLDIHERPVLRRGEAARLPEGAVVTVEPGAYLPGLGGVRIEDTVAVTGPGHEVLTAAPTDLLSL